MTFFLLFEISKINKSRLVCDVAQEALETVIDVNKPGFSSMNELDWFINTRSEEAKNILCKKDDDLNADCNV